MGPSFDHSDPGEGQARADITSNTYWDWNFDHVGSAYGMMDEVFSFIATFDAFPPRAFPPSFNPAIGRGSAIPPG
jgi:hypothetical protein